VRTRDIALAGLLLTVATSSASAHEELAPVPGKLWSAWEFNPVVVSALALSGVLYVRGIRRLWHAARPGAGVRAWEAACFALGWCTLAASLISPLHAWGNALFAAHMTQHELLMLVAAPLIVLGRPLPVFLLALPSRVAHDLAHGFKGSVWGRCAGVVSNALAAWLIHAVALWAWHIPALFQAAVRSEYVHALQHASFFFSALLFWWAIIHGGRAIGYGAALLYMFTTAMHSGLLGALITLTGTVWYPTYTKTAPAWGLTPLEDQQLGGLIMWIPAGLVYLFAGLMLMAGWMRESRRRVRRCDTRWHAEAGASAAEC
jgi:putative membrane protein